MSECLPLMALMNDCAEILTVPQPPVSLRIHVRRVLSDSLSLLRRVKRQPSSGSQQQKIDERVCSICKSTTTQISSNWSIHPEMDTTPRRSTVTTIIPRQRAVTPRFGQAQCTHLTVTRLYTKEFRCSVCFREGPAGWLWRCTQDRELLLEEDMERGLEVSMARQLTPHCKANLTSGETG